MAKYSDKRIPYSKQDKMWTDFCTLVANMKDIDEVKRFFKDLFNRQERIMLCRRFHIAEMLEQDMTYQEIGTAIGASPTTIARIHKLLKFGRDGYKKAIKRKKKLKSKK